MIQTVFIAGNSATAHWQASLLEYSWQCSGQPGELIRLFPAASSTPLPVHKLAQVVRTMDWETHPYLLDQCEAYNTPASLLEWLLRDKPDTTILLLRPDSVFQQPIATELNSGEAIGNGGMQFTSGDAAFGLANEYRNLQAYCVNRSLELPRVQMPLLIHAKDLVKLCARWLELIGIIRMEAHLAAGPAPDAQELAYAIAAAEYRIPHKVEALTSVDAQAHSECPVLSYTQPIESPAGRILFDPATYSPGDALPADTDLSAGGRQIIDYLARFEAERSDGQLLRRLRPQPLPGVRQAQVLDQLYLETGSPPRLMTLNASAGEIWKRCDGVSSLYDIADNLQKEFDVPMSTMVVDVEQTALSLKQDGVLELEPIAV